MYFSVKQRYSHNRLQRSVHLQDLLWSRKDCIKAYTKILDELAEVAGGEKHGEMFEITVSKSVSWWFSPLPTWQIILFFFVCFNKQIQG